jgi:hypothetical protein
LNAISQFKFQFAHEVAVDAIAQIFWLGNNAIEMSIRIPRII